jgi:hypothetical protein
VEQSSNSGPLAPPPETGELPPYERMTVWPKRLGILLIVLGAIGILTVPMAMSIATQEAFIRVMLPKDVTPDPEAIRQAAIWKAVLSVLSGVLSVPVVAAGIGLLRKRAWGTKLAILAAALSVGLALVAAAVDMMINKGIDKAAGRPVNLLGGGMLISLVLNLALPVFLLIWFALPAIREETAAWR